eukprot:JP446803.1.p1 GENE.JP446803.1~~JP446803.1.p1  ORF type:complete len:271 (+),score=81.59 JP446803.1:24-836(+)
MTKLLLLILSLAVVATALPSAAVLPSEVDDSSSDASGASFALDDADVDVQDDVEDGVEEETSDVNIARGKPAYQSTTTYGGVASRAVDGNTIGSYGARSVTHTGKSSSNWWKVNFGGIFDVSQVKIYNRLDCCSQRLNDFVVQLRQSTTVKWSKSFGAAQNLFDMTVPAGTQGDNLIIRLNSHTTLSLAEVEVFGFRNVGTSASAEVLAMLDMEPKDEEVEADGEDDAGEPPVDGEEPEESNGNAKGKSQGHAYAYGKDEDDDDDAAEPM